MSQRRKNGYFADARAQWTTMALIRMFDGGPPVWDPSYPQQTRVRLQCQSCRAELGKVNYHDGTAHGASVPVYLAEVHAAVTNPDARPVEIATMTVVLSPLTIDLGAIWRVTATSKRFVTLDEPARRALGDFLSRLADQYPDGQIPVTANPAEEIQPVCNVRAHRPQAISAGTLLAAARAASNDRWTRINL